MFLTALRRLVCVAEDAYLPLEDTEAVSFRSLEKALLPTTDNTRSEGSKLERDVEEILSQINSLALRNTQVPVRADVRTEWYKLAQVLDRLLAIVFTVIVIVYSFALLG